QRHSTRDDRNDADTPTAQDQDDHHHHQHDGFQHRGVHRIDGALNEHGAVVRDLQRHALRQVLVDQLDFLAHLARQVERVGGGLLGDADGQAGLAVEPGRDPFVGRPHAYLGDLAHAHRVAIDRSHHDVLELLDRLQVGGRHHRKLPVTRLDAPGGYQHILLAERVLDILHDQAVAGELLAVDIDAHGGQALAEHADLGRTRQHGQARLDIAIDVVGGLHLREAAGDHAYVHNGCG